MLFIRFKNGDEKAFKHFYDLLYSSILGFCMQFIDDEEQSNHIVQEAFINLWLHRTSIEKPGGIRSFLYTAAKSRCLNHLKHEKVKRRYRDNHLAEKENQLNISILDSMTFDELVIREMEEIISQFIEALPEQTRAIFKLKRFEGKKNSEIAEELNISIKTVEAHFTKALRTLRKQLKDYFPELLIAIFLQNL
ncbi:RNA polymerase sigma-70 factor [Robertkochia solimangrovi]|nr:RNA polymerase sigma-70 factor [Robertkochia solimangrovi]